MFGRPGELPVEQIAKFEPACDMIVGVIDPPCGRR
jgi:hypothetical protein